MNTTTRNRLFRMLKWELSRVLSRHSLFYTYESSLILATMFCCLYFFFFFGLIVAALNHSIR